MKKPSLSRPGNGGGLHIVNCSLGKDSVALLIRMVQEGWKIDKVLFADLGEDAEFQETYGFLKKVESTLGVQIERVTSDCWTWDDIFYSKQVKGKHIGKCRGFPPAVGPGCRYKGRLKQEPLQKAQGVGNTIYLGIAVDEKHRAEAKHYLSQPNTYRFPLIEWNMTEADCKSLCQQYDLLHPLYQYFERLGCWQCPKQSLQSLRQLRKHWPDKWEKLKQYQKSCEWPFRADYSVDELEIRFAFEDERLAADLPINRTREFMSELRKRLEEAGFPQNK